MPIKTEEEARFYVVEIARNLPLSKQIHQANAQICSEAAGDEKVLLEEIGFRNGFRVLRYRLWREKPVKR